MQVSDGVAEILLTLENTCASCGDALNAANLMFDVPPSATHDDSGRSLADAVALVDQYNAEHPEWPLKLGLIEENQDIERSTHLIGKGRAAKRLYRVTVTFDVRADLFFEGAPPEFRELPWPDSVSEPGRCLFRTRERVQGSFVPIDFGPVLCRCEWEIDVRPDGFV